MKRTGKRMRRREMGDGARFAPTTPEPQATSALRVPLPPRGAGPCPERPAIPASGQGNLLKSPLKALNRKPPRRSRGQARP